MNLVNLFHVGPQKSGTTWLYRALAQHPDVCTHTVDSIHYFNMFYHCGDDWYHNHFPNRDRKILFDPSPSYLRDAFAPARIARYNPAARIIFTARNPIDRAFSHYWHERKKDRFNFDFEEGIKNYDLYCNWLEPGFYATHLRRYLDHFPEEQIKVLFFDDLKQSTREFYGSVCEFCEIDASVLPDTISTRVNAAARFRSRSFRNLDESLSSLPKLQRTVTRLYDRFISPPMASVSDVDSDYRKLLIEVFRSDIEELEAITGRNLNHWKVLA